MILFVYVSDYCHYYAYLSSCLRGLFFSADIGLQVLIPICIFGIPLLVPVVSCPVYFVSPLQEHVFARELAGYADQSAVRFVLDGPVMALGLVLISLGSLSPPKRISLQPISMLRSLLGTWPMRCLSNGYSAPFRLHLYPTST